MERILSINPKRIQWCCEDRAVTVDNLASDVAIPQQVMAQLMKGDAGITFNQLQRVANYFNRGVLFFLELEAVNEARVHTPQYRTITNQKPEISPKIKALIERVERHREIYLSLREDLEEETQPLFALPELPKQKTNIAAVGAREWLSLTEKNDFETYRKAVEARGIIVFRSNGYAGPWQIPKENPICGFSLYDASCPVIVIKKQAYITRQVFSLMHELGHILLHQSSFVDEEIDLYSYQGKEHEANAFAGYLLVPDTFLKMIDDRTRPSKVALYDDWLEHYRNLWGVSGEVILRRLFDAGRLEKELYESYREMREQFHFGQKETGSRKYRYREPRNVFGDPYVRTVLDALNTKHISLAKASTYLDNIKIRDVHKLERFYAYL
jgi:Zn-dependent peptidase ImmA (M78 family)